MMPASAVGETRRRRAATRQGFGTELRALLDGKAMDTYNLDAVLRVPS